LDAGFSVFYVRIVFLDFEKFEFQVCFNTQLENLTAVSGRDYNMILATIERMGLSSYFHMLSIIRQEEDLGIALCIYGRNVRSFRERYT